MADYTSWGDNLKDIVIAFFGLLKDFKWPITVLAVVAMLTYGLADRETFDWIGRWIERLMPG